MNFFEDRIKDLPVCKKTQIELEVFCRKIVQVLGKKVLSIAVFGSILSDHFSEYSSDVNLMVILSELEIHDLFPLVNEVQKWFRKRKFSPRFISKRNLFSSLKYFPIYFWTIKQNYKIIYGQDFFENIEINKKDLLEQLRRQIKGLRMRVKQHFWISLNNRLRAVRSSISYFNSINYLMSVYCYLKEDKILENSQQVIDFSENEFKTNILRELLEIKKGKYRLSNKETLELFTKMHNFIRSIDEKSEELKI